MHTITGTGVVGMVKDLSAHELPDNAWTDVRNIRFLDGLAYQFMGYREVYATPPQTPQYVMPCLVSGALYWLYATAAKTYCVSFPAGSAVHTDITHLTPRSGVANQWTGTLLSGVPILNAGDMASYPMAWSLNIANKFVDLANWPANTYCKSLRAFKNYLVALNVTKSGTNYPYMVKWSHPASPGALPSSWDIADATKEAGEADIAEGGDVVVDGGQLRDSFIIYKQNSTWRMDFVGGAYVFRFVKVLGVNGAMNRNSWVEYDGLHYVLSNADVMVHDGQSGESIIDKGTRRWLFQSIDRDNTNLCFMFKNTFFNEVCIAFPSVGSIFCDKALVYNIKDKTTSLRDLPNVYHAVSGGIDSRQFNAWNIDTENWLSDVSTWTGTDFVSDTQVTVAASSNGKLYGLDISAAFDGALPSSVYLERSGLSFGSPDKRKLVKGVRARITGNVGTVVTVKVGTQTDPFGDITWQSAVDHTIGSTLACDCLVDGRYLAIRFETANAYQWRLDSFDLDIATTGGW